MRSTLQHLALAFSFLWISASVSSAADFSVTANSEVTAETLSGNASATFSVFNFPPAPPPAGVSVMGPVTLGSGVVTTTTFTNDPGFGTQSASVAGSALAPPDSLAFVAVETHDFVEVFNNNGGTTPAVLEFTFTYDATAMVSAAVGDEAAAHYNFHITGADDEVGELLEIDTGGGFVPVADFEVDDLLLASLGDTMDIVGPTSVGVRYTVDAFGVNGADGEYAFSIFTRADGQALSPASTMIPEPASIAIWCLLGLAISGAICYRCRTFRA